MKSFAEIDIEKNGFVWLRISELKAHLCFLSRMFSVYILNEDGSGTLILEHKEINKASFEGKEFGLEVGYIDPEIAMRM